MLLEELTEVLGLKINEAQWKAGERAVDGLKEGLAGLGEKSGLSKIIKTGLASFVGYEAISGVKEMILSVVELGSALNDTAQKTGLSVEGLQFYGYVAKLNSSNLEEVAGASEKLSKGLSELAHTGTGPAADGLKAIGLSASNAKFKAASMDDKMQMIAEHISKLPDGAKKTAAAMDLFGRSGAQLIPTLNDLGQNGAKLRGEFGELGGALSGDNVKALDDFGDEVDKTKYSLTALKNSVVVALLPTLKDMLGSVQAWIKANKQLIAQKVEHVLLVIADAAKFIGRALLTVIDALGFVQQHFETLGPIIAAIIAIFNPWQTLIAGLVLISKAFVDAFVDGKGPLAGFAAWIKALIAEIKQEFQSLADTAGKVWDTVSSPFKKIGHGLSSAAGAVQDFFGGNGDNAPIQFNPLSAIAGGPAAQLTPTAASSSGSGGSVTTQEFNSPITVHVNGGDPEETKAAVKSAVEEANKSMIRQAWHAIGGK